MKKIQKVSVVALTAVLTFGVVGFTRAATTIDLGAANNFAIMAGSTITNTGSTVVTGDLGLSPGTSVTGFPPGTVNGTQHIANAAAAMAKTAMTTASANAAGQTPVSTVPTELGGTTKTAGVYTSAAGTFSITGTLTLDAQSDPNAVFIFKTASTLITAGASTIVLANGAQACNIFWQVGSSATLGMNSLFKGSILASESATLTSGAKVEGQVLAQNGAVTLDTNTVTKATCAAAIVVPVPTPTVVPTSTPVVVPVVTSTPATPMILPTVVPVVTSTPTVTPVILPTTTSTPVVAPVSSLELPVTVPKLPNAGITSDEKSISIRVAILVGIATGSLFLFVIRKKQIE